MGGEGADEQGCRVDGGLRQSKSDAQMGGADRRLGSGDVFPEVFHQIGIMRSECGGSR